MITNTDISPSVLEFLKEHGNKIKTGGKEYYFLPFWFEVVYESDRGDDCELGFHSLGELPDDLKSVIQQHRDEQTPQT